MIISSSDNERIVDIGSSDIWISLCSTVFVRLDKNIKKYPLAVEFLRIGTYEGKNAYEVARQINLIRDDLSQIPPDKAVYDMSNLKAEAPWKNNLSPVITSCANYFTTADGKDLLFELVSILCYAAVKDVSVSVND